MTTTTNTNNLPTTQERAAYNALRQRAIEGEDISEDLLRDSLQFAIAAEARQEFAHKLENERAEHKAAEAKEIANKRKAAKPVLDDLAQQLVAAKAVRTEAHTAMKDAIMGYNDAARAERGVIASLTEALRAGGYPDAHPRHGAESVYVHPEMHYDDMTSTVRYGKIAANRPEMARTAIPRFLSGIKAD